jgi:CspA family cold shock protein
MARGRIKKLTSKGFGFIETETGDLFFHASSLNGTRFDDLQEGQQVEYQLSDGPKGARAEGVQPLS